MKVSKVVEPLYRRSFGYVADIVRVDSINAASPLLLTAVFMLNFKYLRIDDQAISRTYSRVASFSANASVSSPIALAISDPIAGVRLASRSR